jgi:hypothetical protein
MSRAGKLTRSARLAGYVAAMAAASGTDPKPDQRELGGWRDRDVWMAEDFDDPLPAALQSAFEDPS